MDKLEVEPAPGAFERDPKAVQLDLLDVADANPGVREEALHDFLDLVDVKRIEADGGGNGVELTLAGRVASVVEERDVAIKRAEQAEERLATVDPDKLVKAKMLLSECFKWLGAFKNTADLRQKIVLFMEDKT